MWVRFPPGVLIYQLFGIDMEDQDKSINSQIEQGKTDAILSYIPFLCFIPLFKSNLTDFAKKHTKQGLLLLIVEIIALFFLVDIVNDIFWTLVLIGCGIFALTGIIKSLSGKEMKIPFIGTIFEKYDI